MKEESYQLWTQAKQMTGLLRSASSSERSVLRQAYIELLNQAIAVDPTARDIYKDRAGAYIANGAFKTAFDDYDTFIKLSKSPDELFEAHNEKLLAYHDSDLPIESVKGQIMELTWLIENGFATASILGWRAQHYIRQGQLTDAIADLEDAFQIDPLDGYPLLKAAAIHTCLKHYDQAYQSIQRQLGACQYAGVNCIEAEGIAHARYAVLYFEEGKPEWALQEFLKSSTKLNERSLDSLSDYLKLWRMKDCD